jgi:hypothetical protein
VSRATSGIEAIAALSPPQPFQAPPGNGGSGPTTLQDDDRVTVDVDGKTVTQFDSAAAASLPTHKTWSEPIRKFNAQPTVISDSRTTPPSDSVWCSKKSPCANYAITRSVVRISRYQLFSKIRDLYN